MPVDVNKLEAFLTTIKTHSVHLTRENHNLSWVTSTVAGPVQQDLKSNNIHYEKRGNSLTIDLNSQDFSYNVKYFEEKNFAHIVGSPEFSRPFVLIGNDLSFICHSPNSAPYESMGVNASIRTLYHNSCNYIDLYNYIKTVEFSQHHDESKQEIVLYSSSRGIFKIKYDGKIPLFKGYIKDKVGDLIHNAKETFFKIHLIHAIIDYSSNKTDCAIRELIDNSIAIIENAKNNYALAARQFDFDKVRNALQKEKEKFFSNIRDITNRSFSQIIAVPISASATAFISYKVDGNLLLNLALLLGLGSFTTLYMIVQATSYDDLQLLKKDFDRDFDYIKRESGIATTEIESEKIKLDLKISNSNMIILISMLMVTVVNTLIALYVLIQIAIKLSPPFIQARL